MPSEMDAALPRALPPILTLCLLAAGAAKGDDGMEKAVWKGLPLVVSMRPDQERSVFFPARVLEVRVPAALDGKLRTQVLDKGVHWRPAEPFARQRAVVSTAGGNVYLLDLAVSEHGGGLPIEIVDGEPVAGQAPPAPQSELAPVRLTRFAARHLYAPERLRPDDAGISRLAPPALPEDSPLIQGVNLAYKVLAAWRGYGHHVTALQVRNRSSLQIPLDPRLFEHRRIRGRWTASTFQHRWLKPASSAGAADTTVLYLVSRQPFRASLRGDAAP